MIACILWRAAVPAPVQYSIGQRVRIVEEEDPAAHVGKMAIVQRIEFPDEGAPICVLRVDRIPDPLSMPQDFLEAIVATPSSLLANDLFLPWDMDDPRQRLREYTEDNRLAGHVLETLFFYDRLVVPTVDYSIIVPLVHWLGMGLLKEMLVTQAISFVRYAGSLGYRGNGNGLALFELRPGDKPEPWWVIASRCPPQEAVTLQLRNRLPSLNEGAIELFAKLVELSTVDTALPEFVQKVEEETYRDILGSDILSTYFSIGNSNLKWLGTLRPNEMRVFTSLSKPAVAGDEIDITLRLAMLNLETYLAEEAGARDMVTDRDFGRLLDAKIHRYTSGRIAHQAFSHLVTIEDLPDIASSITNGEVGLADAWEFRNTKSACQFRDWFDRFGPTSPLQVEKEYVRALRARGLWSSGRAKVMRFVVVQAVGVGMAPVTGGMSILASIGLSAADCFLLERVRRGYNPRYFVDELRHHMFCS